jgi:hypothetical protein
MSRERKKVLLVLVRSKAITRYMMSSTLINAEHMRMYEYMHLGNLAHRSPALGIPTDKCYSWSGLCIIASRLFENEAFYV